MDDEGCRTPDRGVGVCIVIKTCEPVMNFIRDSPKPISLKAAETIRRYQCGVQGNDVKVCCPNKPIPLVDAVVTVPDVPPNVLNHNNLNLLPLTKCGPFPNDDRILNGNKTSLYEFPWMVLLAYQTSKYTICF